MVGIGDSTTPALGHRRYVHTNHEAAQEQNLKLSMAWPFYFFFPLSFSFFQQESATKINPQSLWIQGAGLLWFAVLPLVCSSNLNI